MTAIRPFGTRVKFTENDLTATGVTIDNSDDSDYRNANLVKLDPGFKGWLAHGRFNMPAGTQLWRVKTKNCKPYQQSFKTILRNKFM